MLRGMAHHREGVPRAAPDGQHVAFAHRAKIGSHRRHELSEVVAAPAEGFYLRLGHPVASVVVEALLGLVAAHALPRQLRHEPLGLRAPEIDPEALGQPVGVADVIGMEVGDQHPPDRALAQLACEEALPQGAGGRQAHSGIDHRDPVTVLQEPQVDVVQLERQRHPDPADAGRDLDADAALRRLRPGVHEPGGGRGQWMLGLGLHRRSRVFGMSSMICHRPRAGRPTAARGVYSTGAGSGATRSPSSRASPRGAGGSTRTRRMSGRNSGTTENRIASSQKSSA